jgi:hypothetical protein
VSRLVGDDGCASGGGLVAAAGAAVALAGFVTLGSVVAMGTEDRDPPPADGTVTDVEEGKVPATAYRSVSLGASKDAVTEQLLPARPVDSRILDRYEDRSPEAVATSCAYYESEPPPADDLYRFCFEQDRLVEKTFVLPEDDQPIG